MPRSSRKISATQALLLAAMGTLGWAPNAHANVGEAYGFGSRSSALAGTGVAHGFNGYAAYANPAGLPLVTAQGRRFAFDLSLLYMNPSFLPIENVITTNDYVADNLGLPSTVDTSYRSTLGQSLGAAIKVADAMNLAAGIVAYIPVNQLAYIDTGETYHPEYVLYRARTQRPQLEAALGATLLPELHVGAGMHLGFSLTSNATVFLSTLQNKPSSMRFLASMKAKASPYLGALWTPSSRLSAGAVLRFPMSSPNSMTLKTATGIGPFDAFDFNFLAASALYYDPLSIELGATYQHADAARLIVQLDYQAWRNYEFPALQLEACDPGTDPACGTPITSSLNPSFPLRNILIPRIAEEISLSPSTTLRVGYGYRPGIFSELPSGAGNYLDPSKHMFSLGAGHRLDHLQIDVHLTYHQLITEHVTKTPGNEIGTGSGDFKIGAPGYDAGGKILGGGVSLSWLF